ncbi:hypothetical protein [Leifsonia shinshuensis]
MIAGTLLDAFARMRAGERVELLETPPVRLVARESSAAPAR